MRTSHLKDDLFRRTAFYRFDAPDGSFGVLYAAFDLETAFVESIIRENPFALPAGEALLIDYATLASRHAVTFKSGPPPRPLRLAKLYDDGLAAVRTDNRISTIDDYATTQLWAKALHDHPQEVDGIVYMSRFLGNRRSVALFDRARDAIGIKNQAPLLEHEGLAHVLDTYQVGVVPRFKDKGNNTTKKQAKKKK